MEERFDSSVEGVANRTQESLGVLERSLTETVERAVVETSDTVSGIRSDLTETVSDVYDRIEQIVETIEHMLTSGGILRFSTTAIPVLISGVVIIQNCCASRREKKMLDTLKRIHGHMKRLNLQTSPV